MDRPVMDQIPALLRQGMAALLPEATFTDIARELFARQYRLIPAVRSLADEAGMAPDQVQDWRQIPPLPVAAFKHSAVFAADPARAAAWFESSGTTAGPERRSRHFFATPEYYAAALLPPFRHFLLPDRPQMRILALTPDPAQAPHSSLSWYLGQIIRQLGRPGSGHFWETGLASAELAAALRRSQAEGEPVLLAGTAFAFVHFSDDCRRQGLAFRLPPGSRAMETGGFKGRSRELSQPELYAEMAATLGIAPEWIVNQFGMTELSSQFYEPTLRAALGLTALGSPSPVFPRPKLGPPWTRILIRHPNTLRPVPAGQPGLVEVVDLANVDSAVAVLTQDLGVATPDGLVLLGRAAGAEPRGCSLAADPGGDVRSD